VNRCRLVESVGTPSKPDSSRWSAKKFGRSLQTARAVAGIKDGASVSSRLLCGTWEPVPWVVREKSKWQTHEDESTDTGHRDGRARTSEEAW